MGVGLLVVVAAAGARRLRGMGEAISASSSSMPGGEEREGEEAGEAAQDHDPCGVDAAAARAAVAVEEEGRARRGWRRWLPAVVRGWLPLVVVGGARRRCGATRRMISSVASCGMKLSFRERRLREGKHARTLSSTPGSSSMLSSVVCVRVWWVGVSEWMDISASVKMQ